jgi:RING-variant domain
MASETQANPDTAFTYPTRHCRLCHEDVVPTVTISNPNLPAPFRSTTITYTSEDGGRLIKPCKCKGTQRYIHEDCLAELRAKSPQKNAYLKCDLCGFEYNTKRLLIHDILLSRVARMLLTILIVALLMFVLGFVADPIINLYVDPIQTLAGQRYWDPVKVDNLGKKGDDSWWIQHFMKGLVSVGVMGFFKAVLLANPWHFWNARHAGLLGGSTRSTTGRDRAVNISWIAVLIGVGSALYFFYQQVAKFSQSTLSKFANGVIEVQMDDDDEDLKVPPFADRGVSKATSSTKTTSDGTSTAEAATRVDGPLTPEVKTGNFYEEAKPQPEAIAMTPEPSLTISPPFQDVQPSNDRSDTRRDAKSVGWSSAIQEAQKSGWSFNSVGR